MPNQGQSTMLHVVDHRWSNMEHQDVDSVDIVDIVEGDRQNNRDDRGEEDN